MRRTLDAARGKWRGVLLHFGVDRKHLTGKHGPCPLCEGTDRFRWDNQDGNGSYICGQCGAGTGMQLLMKLKGWDFKTAANAVDEVLGNVEYEAAPKKPERDPQLLNALWKASRPLVQGDPVWRYLDNRCAGWRVEDCRDLRFCEAAPVPGGGQCLAMIALVRECVTGNPVTLHRTFLNSEGGKADMADPRAIMPGTLPDAIEVRLGIPSDRLGVAEGIETAFRASVRFGVPCWSTINAGFLAKWKPPQGVEGIEVMGDCDKSYTGQMVAYTLANRLARNYSVGVNIPGHENPFGTDWASL